LRFRPDTGRISTDSPDHAGCLKPRRAAAISLAVIGLWKDDSLNSFADFGLAEPIVRALAEEKYSVPTPIQSQAVPVAMTGQDIVGIAQTGTGKTAAFALPILHRLARDRRPVERKSCRVLVLSPTRELSAQILDSFRAYGRHLQIKSALAIGGVSMGNQVRALLNGTDVLIATPGRLLDLLHGNALRLDKVDTLVLDEADRMLDMGFIHDIRKIVAKIPVNRQTVLFSATMPQAIAELAGQLLRNPVKISVAPVAATADRIEQRLIHVDRPMKSALLAEVIKREPTERTLVFTRTKHGADKVVRVLLKAGIAAQALHGNKSQNQRIRALEAFRAGAVRTLVATDIAARGIDVDGVSHVINFDLPDVPESYVHRIGRTARAGAEGVAISFCSAEEMPLLRAIEKLIRKAIPVTERRSAPQHAANAHNGHAADRGHGDRPARNGAARNKGRKARFGKGGGGRSHHQHGGGRDNGEQKPANANGQRPIAAFLHRGRGDHHRPR
jgi:ATP-dependent RNA helicase RhlE